MVLLAMITAAPRSSLEVLDFLRNCVDSTSLADLETHIKAIDPAEAKYVQSALAAYKTAVPNANVTTLNWAPQVARFSFRSGRGVARAQEGRSTCWGIRASLHRGNSQQGRAPFRGHPR